MHAYDVVGYTYAADNYCEHCTACMFEEEDGPSIFDGAEKILSARARERGIDHHDEASYDSGDFPKVIFASMVESSDEVCGRCLEPLVDADECDDDDE